MWYSFLQRSVGYSTMSLLLINSISFISMMCGCLVHSSSTKISRLSRLLYTLNVLQTFYVTISFMWWWWFVNEESSTWSQEFTQVTHVQFHVSYDRKCNSKFIFQYSIVLRVLGLNNEVIIVIKYAVAFGCQSMTLVGSWRQKNLLAKIITEAEDVLRTHNRTASSLRDWDRILIYPFLIAVRFSLISTTLIFDGGNTISTIFFKSFILWAQMAPICIEVRGCVHSIQEYRKTSEMKKQYEKL